MNIMQQQVHQQIHDRLQNIFIAYQQEQDVPPAQLFRAEGFVEACNVLNLISLDEAFQMMTQIYHQVFNQPFPYPQQSTFVIPVFMKRAPVTPST